MKFGFEHDRESSHEAEVSEQTALLANGNAAPEADPAVAKAVTEGRTSKASTIVGNATPVPLEGDTEATLTADHDDSPKQDEKPLPVRQILFLCFARLVEPIAFFSIFPFINQMCARNGNLKPAEVGFYSGLIESLFSLTQMLVMIVWGRLSDRYGRKPILVFSLFGVGFATALFGLAQTIWQMILFRCIAGVFAGTVVTIRTMISEHSTAKTQARSFSWFAFSGNIGIFLGPLIGGALADPAKQYGRGFRGIRFFEKYPYAVATFATGLIALVAAVTTIMVVDETLDTSAHSHAIAEHDPESRVETEERHSTWSLLKAPGVVPVLYLYAHIMLLAFSYTAIVPVFWYEPVAIGGFGFSSLFISIFMGLTGAAQAIWLLLVFPPLQHRIGTGGVLRACAYAYPFFFLTCPALNALLREGSHAAKVVFWIAAPFTVSVGVGVSMSFTAIQLALNDVSPGPKVLGTLNALALTLTSAVRAFSPAAFASLFAVGVKKQILKGYLAWAVMFVIAAGLGFGLRWLPAKAEGKIAKSSSDESLD